MLGLTVLIIGEGSFQVNWRLLRSFEVIGSRLRSCLRFHFLLRFGIKNLLSSFTAIRWDSIRWKLIYIEFLSFKILLEQPNCFSNSSCPNFGLIKLISINIVIKSILFWRNIKLESRKLVLDLCYMEKLDSFRISNKRKNENKVVILANTNIIVWMYVFCFVVLSTKLRKSSSNFILMSIFIIYKIDKLEETVHDNKTETLFCKTPGLNNPKNYVSTKNRFKTCMVLILVILTKLRYIKCLIEVACVVRLKNFLVLIVWIFLYQMEKNLIWKWKNKIYLSSRVANRAGRGGGRPYVLR